MFKADKISNNNNTKLPRIKLQILTRLLLILYHDYPTNRNLPLNKLHLKAIIHNKNNIYPKIK